MKKILNGIGLWYFITICGFLSLIIPIFKWDIDKLHDSWPNLLLPILLCIGGTSNIIRKRKER